MSASVRFGNLVIYFWRHTSGVVGEGDPDRRRAVVESLSSFMLEIARKFYLNKGKGGGLESRDHLVDASAHYMLLSWKFYSGAIAT